MVYQCYTETIHTIYLTVTFVYLAILQIIGIVLAIQTRKIKIKLLNDSKYIAAVIYISSIALFFIGSNVIIPDQFINIEEALFSGSILVGTTFFLALVFIPKVQYIQYMCVCLYLGIVQLQGSFGILYYIYPKDIDIIYNSQLLIEKVFWGSACALLIIVVIDLKLGIIILL